MKNATKPDIKDLTEQLAEVSEQLVQVVRRLDEFEAQFAHGEMAVCAPAQPAKEIPQDDLEGQWVKECNPEAGP